MDNVTRDGQCNTAYFDLEALLEPMRRIRSSAIIVGAYVGLGVSLLVAYLQEAYRAEKRKDYYRAGKLYARTMQEFDSLGEESLAKRYETRSRWCFVAHGLQSGADSKAKAEIFELKALKLQKESRSETNRGYEGIKNGAELQGKAGEEFRKACRHYQAAAETFEWSSELSPLDVLKKFNSRLAGKCFYRAALCHQNSTTYVKDFIDCGEYDETIESAVDYNNRLREDTLNLYLKASALLTDDDEKNLMKDITTNIQSLRSVLMNEFLMRQHRV